MTQETKNQSPIAEVRDRGIKIAIWRHPRKDQPGFRYSGKLQRSYKDANGDWQSTDSFGGEQWLRVARLALQAYDRELELRADEPEQQ